VATNAALNKVQATKLAQMSSAGFARAVSPCWTQADGDVTFALSLGPHSCDLMALGAAAAQAVAQSIVRAAALAGSAAGLPGLLDGRARGFRD
jgi:L-aminopeptidase/D-esterase-like protein